MDGQHQHAGMDKRIKKLERMVGKRKPKRGMKRGNNGR